ncbi:MAG: hypothetical protein JNK24_08340 [Alphaproteobacteria bacterium]|nr:hypothetical protein [Alphaproteobacteria bacterium]
MATQTSPMASDAADLADQTRYLATRTPEGKLLKDNFPNIPDALFARAFVEMGRVLSFRGSDWATDDVRGANDALWDPGKRTFRDVGSDPTVTLDAACARFNYENRLEELPEVNRQSIAGPEGDPNSEVVMQVAEFIRGVVAEQYAGMQRNRQSAASICAQVKP